MVLSHQESPKLGKTPCPCYHRSKTPSLGPLLRDTPDIEPTHPIAHTHLATVPNSIAERGKNRLFRTEAHQWVVGTWVVLYSKNRSPVLACFWVHFILQVSSILRAEPNSRACGSAKKGFFRITAYSLTRECCVSHARTNIHLNQLRHIFYIYLHRSHLSRGVQK